MRIPFNLIDPDPDQPRRHFDEGSLVELGQNIVAHGQQVPMIVYCKEAMASDKGVIRYSLLDGERRWRAMTLVGLKEGEALVLEKRPTQAELAVKQASIEIHKVSMTAMERSNLLARIQLQTGWSVTELAKNLHIKQSMASKLLAIQQLSPEGRTLLEAGKIDIERAYMLSQSSDPALIQQAPTLTREQLRQKIKAKGKPDVKTSSVRLRLPGQMNVTLKGPDFSMQMLVEVLMEAARLVKKAMANGHDVSSVQRYLRGDG